MTQHDYEFRIEDPKLPRGQIPAGDLAALADKLQQLATRLARQAAGAEGPGRSPAPYEQVARLMVTGLGEGSTVLAYRLGEPDTLDLPGTPDEQLAGRFDEIVAGIATNSRPEWVSQSVADAAGQLAAVIHTRFARAQVQVTTPSRVVAVDPAGIDDTVWHMATPVRTQQVSVAGTLYRVDLHTGSFRITDDAGNDIRLEGVHDSAAVGPLVGSRVIAAGTGEYRGGRLTGVVAPVINRMDLPAEWLAPHPHQPVTAGGSFGDGIEGLDADEVEEFLASL